MHYLWEQVRGAIPLIVHRDPFLVSLTWVTIRVCLISTGSAIVIGLPLGLMLGLGRFRGRRVVRALANASLALPPVVVGLVALLILLPQGPLGGLRIEFTIKSMYVVQTILAVPYIVALTPAAIEGMSGGLLAQARRFGARRVQLALLALREARIGIAVAVIAAAAATVSEVGAVIIVGGNFQGHDESLTSALLTEFNYTSNDTQEVAIAIVLFAIVLLLIGSLTVLQQRAGSVRLRTQPD
jgi:tungstate transport system permease protein